MEGFWGSILMKTDMRSYVLSSSDRSGNAWGIAPYRRCQDSIAPGALRDVVTHEEG
jgi:hypothetical protein